MQIIRDAANALQRNLPVVGLFVAGVLVVQCGTEAWQYVDEHDLTGLGPVTEGVFEVIAYALASAGFAVLYAVCFSRLGREIDRPMWRIASDREALRRFFWLWFVIGLVSVVLLLLQIYVAPIALAFGILHLVAFLLAVPAGACIMFQGTIERQRLREAFVPLANRAGETFLVLLMGLVQYILFVHLAGIRQGGSWVLMAIGTVATVVCAAYLDCLMFAATWLICMADRDTIEEPDFEF